MNKPDQEDLNINSREAKQELCRALDDILENARQIIDLCRDQQYTSMIGEASIGKHMRHLLEFFQSLEDGFASSEVNHEARKRNTDYENSRRNAFKALSKSIQNIKEKIMTEDLDQEVVFMQTLNITGRRISASTTIGREIMAVCDHVIHHFASIKMMAVQLGITLPKYFGVSTATIHHKRLSAEPS